MGERASNRTSEQAPVLEDFAAFVAAGITTFDTGAEWECVVQGVWCGVRGAALGLCDRGHHHL